MRAPKSGQYLEAHLIRKSGPSGVSLTTAAHYSPQLLGLEALWAETLGDPDICVAILDGPVDRSHSCFAGASLRFIETLAQIGGTGPASQHGTHVASVILGQHGSPVQGIAPSCTAVAGIVFSDGPEGSLGPCSQLDLARAITQAMEAGAHVINISAGQLSPSGSPEHHLKKAVHLCAENNVLIIAAAGNDGCDCLHVPAALPSVLAVGGMDLQGFPLSMSNWGSAYQSQGVLAPGQDIVGAVPGGGTASKTGTSFANAIVTGIAVLLLSLQRKNGLDPDPQAVRSAILGSATRCGVDSDSDLLCQRFLAGSLNISGAVASLKESVRRTSVLPAESRVSLSSAAYGIAEMPLVSDKQRLNSLGDKTMQDEQIANSNSQIPGVTLQGNASTDSDQSQLRPSANVTGASTPAAQGISPSCRGDSCTCGGKCGGGPPAKPPLVYALGTLSCDFGTEARRDSLLQDGLVNPNDPSALVAYLASNPESATAVVWVLNQDSTPVYAIHPAGAFASRAYERLREFLNSQLTESVGLVSIPGYIAGKTTLINGQAVPVIVPEMRGAYSWSTQKLVRTVSGPEPKNKDEREKYNEKISDIENFLQRVYYEIRNLGASSPERAINYASTNAFQVEQVFSNAIRANLKLDSISADRSPICRPGSDCWDVKLTFFSPAKRLEQARRVYRFTVDVSDVVPVTVGRLRDWDVY